MIRREEVETDEECGCLRSGKIFHSNKRISTVSQCSVHLSYYLRIHMVDEYKFNKIYKNMNI